MCDWTIGSALLASALFGLAIFAPIASGGETPPQLPAAPAGTRVPLAIGTLFIPQGAKAGADGIELLIHLKGEGPYAEKNFVESGRPGVLVWFWDPGLSKVYATHFAEGKALQTMLDETSAQLKARGIGDGTLKRVTVASFSAGYAAVKECLKQEALFKRIDALVLSDTIYGGFVDEATRRVNPADMEQFVSYAREAVEGRKSMLLAHSSEPTPYASTTETANYLLAQLGLTREKADEDWGDGMHLNSTAKKGKFVLFGFSMKGEDEHWLFMRQIGKFYKRIP